MGKTMMLPLIALLAIVITACASPTPLTTSVPLGSDPPSSTIPSPNDRNTPDADIPLPPTTPTPVVFNISGSNFAFSQTELVVNRGDTVKIIFTSEDGFHDWVLDEFNVRTAQLRSPATEEVTFVASKAGTFEYYCSVGNHRAMGMVGKLIVREPQTVSESLFNQDVDSFVTSQEIEDATLRGILVTPKVAGNYPGVVMIHEWWGLNDNIKYMAKLLAKHGYNVFAIDLYDGKVATTSEEASTLAALVRENPDAAVLKMKAAVSYLKNQAGSTKIASLGWCFGGGQSLNLSLDEPLDATVIYYGQLTDNQMQLSKLKGPVLGVFGDLDQSITVASVKAFENALNDLNIPNKISIYSGVGHAFANPSNANYAEKATLDAWDKTLTFLGTHLK